MAPFSWLTLPPSRKPRRPPSLDWGPHDFNLFSNQHASDYLATIEQGYGGVYVHSVELHKRMQARWKSLLLSPVRPLFDSDAQGEATLALSAVADGFDGVRLQAWDAVAVAADGLGLLARYPASDCTVTAQVGDFTRLEPASLTIQGAGG